MNKYIIEDPLYSKYSSKEMQQVFSTNNKIYIWRKLWCVLADAEQQSGLDIITDDQIKEMMGNVNNIDFKLAGEYEKRLKHDVMSHICTYGECCKNAEPIIHLGATSSFITDNCELIQMYDAINIVIIKLKSLIQSMVRIAKKHKKVVCVGFTHGQPAQLTTYGRRIVGYIHDLMYDLDNLLHIKANYKLRGVKGSIGTQSSFKWLLDNYSKVKELDISITGVFGFEPLEITAQTYTRKIDYTILSTLSGIAQSASKFATDIRILQSKGEINEGFSNKQVGSSAMPYKRNPIIAERICALSRYMISLPANSAITSATQWLERSLDDSANRRIVNTQAFLTVDAILILYQRIIKDLTLDIGVIEKHVQEEMPFVTTESILNLATKRGANRQQIHAIIRDKSTIAIDNDWNKHLVMSILSHSQVSKYIKQEEIEHDPIKYVGYAVEQTNDYIKYVESRLK